MGCQGVSVWVGIEDVMNLLDDQLKDLSDSMGQIDHPTCQALFQLILKVEWGWLNFGGEAIDRCNPDWAHTSRASCRTGEGRDQVFACG